MDQCLILASKSPRRKEILRDLGFQLKVVDSNVNETIAEDKSTIEEKVISTAYKKAKAVEEIMSPMLSKEIILASDTVVCLEKEILGKPKNREEAFEMLKKLSDKMHTVITATVILDSKKHIEFEVANKTDVYFKNLNNETINLYLDQNHYLDKAGAYGIQNDGEWLIKNIDGDYFNVMGLAVTTVIGYFKTHYAIEISTDQLESKHRNQLRNFKSDGDSNE